MKTGRRGFFRMVGAAIATTGATASGSAHKPKLPSPCVGQTAVEYQVRVNITVNDRPLADVVRRALREGDSPGLRSQLREL